MHILCNGSVVVPGVVSGDGSVVKYVYQKQEHTVAMELHEEFLFPSGQVQLFVQQGASQPCLLPLPAPFCYSLKRGSVLGFQVHGGVDFVTLWNDCCAVSTTWQHNRPKKLTDPLQKLGLPAKLSEYLREQVTLSGLEVPVGSDESDEDAAAAVFDGQQDDGSGRGSSTYSSSDNDSDATIKDDSEDYYTTTEDEQEDMEEEEEAEDEPEPDELLEDE